MATGTIKANYDIDQTSGNSIALSYPRIIGYAEDVDTPTVFCPFPFVTKNLNYTVSVTGFSIDGVAGGAQNPTAKSKNHNGCVVTGTATMAYNTKFGGNVYLTITFA